MPRMPMDIAVADLLVSRIQDLKRVRASQPNMLDRVNEAGDGVFNIGYDDAAIYRFSLRTLKGLLYLGIIQNHKEVLERLQLIEEVDDSVLGGELKAELGRMVQMIREQQKKEFTQAVRQRRSR